MLGMRDTQEFATHNHPVVDTSKVAFKPMQLLLHQSHTCHWNCLATSMRKLILVTVGPLGVTIMLCLVTNEDRFDVMVVSYHRRQ